jgi:hypothetical protein
VLKYNQKRIITIYKNQMAAAANLKSKIALTARVICLLSVTNLTENGHHRRTHCVLADHEVCYALHMDQENPQTLMLENFSVKNCVYGPNEK